MSKITVQMKAMKFLLFISFFMLTTQSFAYKPQEGNVSAIVGPTLFKTNFGHANVGYQAQERTGFGLVALGDLSKNGAMEIGIFTLTKTYLKERDTKYIVQNAEVLHITMGYRRYINERLSASLTFFSGYSLGNPETVYSQFSPTDPIDTSAKDNTEYGFDIAGQVDIASSNKLSLVLDVRYSLSLTPKEKEYADHFGLLFGLRYIISSSKPLAK